jgi:hypothetical protein
LRPQFAWEQTARAVKPRLDGFLGEIQTGRGVRYTQPFHQSHHEDWPVAGRQGVDRSLQRQPQFAIVSLALRVGRA